MMLKCLKRCLLIHLKHFHYQDLIFSTCHKQKNLLFNSFRMQSYLERTILPYQKVARPRNQVETRVNTNWLNILSCDEFSRLKLYFTTIEFQICLIKEIGNLLIKKIIKKVEKSNEYRCISKKYFVMYV